MKRPYISAFGVLFLSTTCVLAQEKVRGVTDTEIILGSHDDLSGPAATPGIATANGMQMRVDEINAAGGINGRKLRLIVEDTQYQVPRAVQAGNKLINRDNVFAIVGGLGTPMNNAVFPMQEKEGVPNLFPTAQARVLWSPLHRLKFQFNADNQDQIGGAIKWLAQEKGKKSFCIQYQDTDYGKDVLAGAEDQLKKLGLNAVLKQTHKPTDTDLGTQIINLRKANCEVVVLGTLIRDSVIAYTTARRSGWADAEFVTVAGAYDPGVAAVPDGGMEGFFAATPTFIPTPDKMAPKTREWFENYKSKFGNSAPPAAMNAYTAIDLTAIALEKAGKDVTLDGFINGMESIKDYKDVFGHPPQNYSSTNHLGSKAVYIARVSKGVWELAAGPINPD